MLSKRSSCGGVSLVVLVAAAALWSCVSASENGQTVNQDVPGEGGTGQNPEEPGDTLQPFQVSFVPQLSVR